MFHGISYEDMILYYGASKIGLNFSRNMTSGGESKTQMKARMFEVPSAGALLLTEYHEGLEEFYEIDKEIVCFSNPEEMVVKAKYLLESPEVLNTIAAAGHARFLKEHESRVRMSKVLKEVMEK